MNNENNQSIQNQEQQGASGLKTFLASPLGKAVVTIVFAVIIYGITFPVTAMDAEYIALGICILCGYFGWKALNRIQPSMFLWMNITGWIMYFFMMSYGRKRHEKSNRLYLRNTCIFGFLDRMQLEM